MLAFDHLIIAVPDAGAAGRAFEAQYGLTSVVGGRHEGHGTGNRIVPLGPDYLELMEVADRTEASTSPLGAWLLEQVRAGGALAALCLRTDDLDAVAERLGLEPQAMSRVTPEGRELRWRLVGLEQMRASGYPFFIEWEVPSDLHPGRVAVAHRAAPRGIGWVELRGPVDELEDWLGPHELDLRLSAGEAGPRAAGIDLAEGTLVLRTEPAD